MRHFLFFAILVLSSIGFFCGCIGKKSPENLPKTKTHKFQQASSVEHRLGDTLYYGEWFNGKPDGCGIKIYPDSSVHAGIWRNGRKEGIFRTIYSNDSVTFSNWEKGRLVSIVDTLVRKGLYGVDLSKYQYGNWGSMIAVFRQGKDSSFVPVNFVILKATEGRDIVDPLYKYHSLMAEKMRICQGAYHVFSSRSDAKQQVKNFLSKIRPEIIDGPIVLDIEGSSQEISKKKFKQMKPIIKKWLSRVEKQLKRKPMIYCCYDFYKHYGNSDIFKGYDFWIASYSSRKPANNWAIHQFTDQGRICGWPYPVDLDYCPNGL